MTQDGTVTVTVAAGKAHDAAGNANTAANTPATVTYNTTPPTATIALASGQAVLTHDLTVNYVVTFSEAVTDFSSSGMTFGGTAFGTATPTVTVTPSGADGKTYDVAVTGMVKNGTIIASVAADAATDAAGNQNTPSGNAPTVTLDTTVPTVTIVPVPGQSTSAGLPLRFTATFSEAVTDFTNSSGTQVVLSGTAAGAAAAATVAGSGENYTITVNGATRNGTLTISIGAGAVHDAAGNGNRAYSITFSTAGPTVAIAPASGQPSVTSSFVDRFHSHLQPVGERLRVRRRDAGRHGRRHHRRCHRQRHDLHRHRQRHDSSQRDGDAECRRGYGA